MRRRSTIAVSAPPELALADLNMNSNESNAEGRLMEHDSTQATIVSQVGRFVLVRARTAEGALADLDEAASMRGRPKVGV